MVQEVAQAVGKVSRTSAIYASLSQAIVFLNLVQYLGAGFVNAPTLIILQFLFWTSIFGVMMFAQMSWIAYMVYTADLDFREASDPPTPLPTRRTKHYAPTKRGYVIDKEVEEYSRVGEEE